MSKFKMQVSAVCKACHSAERLHKARGYCEPCYRRVIKEEKEKGVYKSLLTTRKSGAIIQSQAQ